MKNLSYFLLSFVLFFSSGVFAQGHSKDTNPNKDKSEFEKPQHKHPHKELLKKERTEFEKVLSESEKATIEKARIELKSLKSTYKKKDKSELTKEEWAQIMEKKKAIMLPVSEIAKTHETELNGVIKKLHEQKMDYKKGKECQGKKEDACKKDKS
ncbi:MAG: hypothetical protein KDC83_08335, partial [Flavobacteriales bacterium]|nr:hypothetical protein [Flavobacteriales bacterium]